MHTESQLLQPISTQFMNKFFYNLERTHKLLLSTQFAKTGSWFIAGSAIKFLLSNQSSVKVRYKSYCGYLGVRPDRCCIAFREGRTNIFLSITTHLFRPTCEKGHPVFSVFGLSMQCTLLRFLWIWIWPCQTLAERLSCQEAEVLMLLALLLMVGCDSWVRVLNPIRTGWKAWAGNLVDFRSS